MKKTLFTFIFVFVLLSGVFWLTGCGESTINPINLSNDSNNSSTTTNTNGAYTGSKSFSTIAQGSTSGLTAQKNYIIKNSGDFQSFWNKYNGNKLMPETIPLVDFDKKMVLAIAMGEKSTGGYSITITNIEEKVTAIQVFVEKKDPSGGIVTQAFTQPYHIVVTDKSDKTISFLIN